MTNFNCENAHLTISRDAEGRSWEHFWVGESYKFSNQIPNRQSFTTTNPGWPLADRGLCSWAGSPPPRGPATSETPTVPSRPLVADASASPTGEGMADPAAGGLMLLALVGAGIWQFIAGRRKAEPDYNPHADLDLTLPPMGNFAAKQTHGIRGVEGDSFAGNSHSFEGNSHVHQTETGEAQNQSFPEVTAVSQGKDWPEMPLPFDPLQPEQGDEFDLYRYLVEKDGLSAKGADIIKQLWGVSPGRSNAYAEARKRRDEFAKRLEYYRYEGR